MMVFPEILRASDEVSGPIFCKIFVYIYIEFYMIFIRFKWMNAFSMSYMCL